MQSDDNQLANELYQKLDTARLAAYAQLKDEDPAAAEFVKEPWNGQVHNFTNSGYVMAEIYTYGRRDVQNFTPENLFNISEADLVAKIVYGATDAVRFQEKSGKYAKYAPTEQSEPV